MMTLSQCIEELFQRGVELWIDDGQLQYHDPLGKLTPELTSSFEHYKSTILSSLGRHSDKPIIFYPLSSAQKTLWFLYQLAPNSSAYNIKFSARIRSAINVSAFQRAFQALIDRYPSLRTTYTTLGETPIQFIHEHQQIPFELIDASAWSQEDLHKRMLEEADRLFDLERGPILRVYLFSRSPKEHILWLLIHHIAVDFGSFEMLIEELGGLYSSEKAEEPTSLPFLDVQYADYIRWEAQMLTSPEGEQHWAFWQKQLAGELPVLNLPTDRPRPPIQTYRTSSHFMTLSEELTQRITAMAQAEGTTLHTILVSVFFVLLHRYTAQEDILLGTPISEQSRHKFKGIVGYFDNPIPLRAAFSKNLTFREFLSKMHQALRAAFEHQDYPSHLLAKQLRINHDSSHPTLFQAIFMLQQLHQHRGIAPFLLGQRGGQIDLDGFEMESIGLEEQMMIFVDLQLMMIEDHRTLSALWQYNTDLFDATTIERMAEHFVILLEGIVTNPDRCIADIPILSEAERHQILVEWNDTKVDCPKDGCLHNLFEAQVERTPDSIAVVFEDQYLTYRELNVKANQLAHYLKTIGVGPNVLVGVCVERSLEMLIGLLGILKAGGAYVPLDPEYPPDRLAFMLEDSQIPVLLTQQRLIEQLPASKARVLCIDTDWEVIAREHGKNPASGAMPDNLAYMIYTSGSTGKPKGVLINHSNVVRLFSATQPWYHFNDQDVWTLFHSYAFDFSVWELWGAFLYGGRLVVVPYWISRTPEAFYDLLRKEQVTVLNQTPSAFRQLIRAEETVGFAKDLALRLVIFGGEALELQSLKPWFERHGDISPQLVNMYGITETTVHVTYRSLTVKDVSEASGSVIGRPIPDLQVYVLDRHLQPVPIGVTGEMYVSGAGVSQGYLNREELTSERFIPNPFGGKSQGRLYKTGDLGRYLPDGDLEYLGRIDFQVQIRGFRVELGEIESVLSKHPMVREAIVTAREDTRGHMQLVTYLVPNLNPDRVPYQCDCLVELDRNRVKLSTEDISFDGVSLVGVPPGFIEGQSVRLRLLLPSETEERWLKGKIAWCRGHQAGIQFILSAGEQTLVHQSVENFFETQGFAKLLQRNAIGVLRTHLKQKLPDYMVPSSLVLLDAFPLTPSGKVNRRALPAPERTRPELEGDFVAPRSAVEKMLANIWSKLLDLERVGIHDNFFELGGNSLTITQLASRLRGAFQIEVPIPRLFEVSTIAELAVEVEKSLIEAGIQTILRRKETGSAPLSSAEQRLWFLEQLEEGMSTYNIPLNARLKGSLNLSILERSINEIVRRHEVLRASFTMLNGQPVHRIAPTLSVTLVVKDLRELPEDRREIKAQKLADEDAQGLFDLTQCPLFRISLLQLGEEEYIFLMTIHHIIYDGWSVGVFMEELTTLYEAFSSGKPSPLPELPVQYTDFAQWQHEWMQDEVLEDQLSYWKHQLSGSLPLVELPTDRPRPIKQTFKGEIQSFALPPKLSLAIKALSQQVKVTPFMMLLAVFKILLYRYTGQEDIIVGSPIANRNRAEIEKLIGFFVNTLVLRTDLSGNPTFRELLERVRRMTLEAQAHQDIPLDRIITELHLERDLDRQPLFQVMFASQDLLMQKMEFSGVILEPMEIHNGTAMFDLTLDIAETEQGLSGSFEYNTDLFDAATITRMINHFQTLLEGIVADQEQRISELPILTGSEQHKILVEWNNTMAEYPVDMCIHELFEAQVERSPDAIAAVFEETQMTYRELNHRANQLAHYLRKRDVGPETLVCICMGRSLEMLVGILGILKSGAAYAPIDPANPKKRMMLMLEDMRAPVLVTQEHLRDKFSAYKTHIVCLDSDWDHISTHENASPRSDVMADNLAYVIYTSGSTGIPKGVLISHQALVNRSTATVKNYDLGPEDRVLQFASISFDVSLEEIFPSLLSGATIVLRSEQQAPMSFEVLSTLVKNEKLTILNLPTAYWHEWVSELSRSNSQPPSSLRLVVVGTEQASAKHLASWKRLVSDRVRWINAYGPTEATITTTMYDAQLHKEDRYANTVPIGRPLSNTRLYILDRCLLPVPIGIPGELYISSVSLARGYLRRPELTDEVFIPDPFNDEPGARLYKTGDLVRYLPDGNIEFLGRVDHQVKIRGFRVELGEIETSLTAHPAIHEAVVVVREDASGNKRLAAYIISDREERLSISELRDFLKKHLPDYMVPAIFMSLEAFPLTSSGKIDRRNLPDPDFDRSEFTATFVAPRDSTEELLVELWTELLGFEQIGVYDNFFDLGGHSLLSMQLMSKISTVMNLDVSVKLLFLHPTIARLATALRKLRRGNDIIGLTPTESTPDVGQALSFRGNRRRQAPSLFKVESESLVNSAPFEAIALDYFLTDVLTETGLSRDKVVYDWCNNRPVLYNVAETDWGRIGVLMLPLFDFELYRNKEALLSHIVDALEISRQLGARMVSLTGLLPSATNYGQDVVHTIAARADLPMITTGHDTTCAAVVLTIREILRQSGRDLAQERVGFLGLGSIGLSSLRLMLRSLPHPAEIILCDVHAKLNVLEKIQQELIDDFGFRGKVRLAAAQTEIPPDIYETTLIVGATNVPDILDIDKVRPGTMIVDDSGPHCFALESAISRFQEQGDILFTEGGVLRSPHPITDRVYLPPSMKKDVDPIQITQWFSLKGSPFDVTSCVFSPLLSARFEKLEPTVGSVDSKAALQHYDVLDLLGFRGADLHCEDYIISEESIRNFRLRFGKL